MRSFDLASIRSAFRSAPLAWVGALAVAALPAAALALKPSSAAPAATPVQSGSTAVVAPAPRPAADSGEVSLSSLFGGADNPFLTEEQARDRRFRESLSKVEEVLRRRPDVRDVTVLASATADGKSTTAGAVVSIRMREGVVPVALVDAVGTLVSAAVPGLKAADVTVIDEATGIRARAVALDEAQSMDGRKALAAAAERAVPARETAPAGVAVTATSTATAASAGAPSWMWVAIGLGVAGFALIAWMALHRRRADGESGVVPAAEDPIAGTLAMALHRCVAEQGALVTTALVERLEQGASANEVAQLLLNLEPWAAERLLKGMPPEALAKVEQALRDPAGDAPIASVRALAEAVLSVRAAA